MGGCRVCAERLGVRKFSLYNHVSGIGDLRRELAPVGLRELDRSLSHAAVGKKGVLALAEAYRSFVKERPGLYKATVESHRFHAPEDPELRAAEGEALEPVLAVLDSLGVRGEGPQDAATVKTKNRNYERRDVHD